MYHVEYHSEYENMELRRLAHIFASSEHDARSPVDSVHVGNIASCAQVSEDWGLKDEDLKLDHS